MLRCRESNLDALSHPVPIHCSNDVFRLVSVKSELREIGLVNVDRIMAEVFGYCGHHSKSSWSIKRVEFLD